MKPDIRIFDYALKAVWIKQGLGKLQTGLAAENPPDCEVDNLTEFLKIF